MLKFSREQLFTYLIYFLILSGPIVDIANGFYIQFVNESSSVTPGVIFRGGIIYSILMLFSLRKKSSYNILFIGGLAVIFFSHILYLAKGFDISFLDSLSRYLKYFLPFIGFIALQNMNRYANISSKGFWRLGFLYGFITAIGIIIFSVTGLSVSTYSYQAYTSTGLLKAQNDTGLVLIVSYCLFLYYNHKYQANNIRYLIIVSIVYFTTVILLSTRAALIGLPVAFFVFFGFKMFSSNYKLNRKQKLFITFLLFGVVVVGVKLVQFWMENDIFYTINKFQELTQGDFRRRVPKAIDHIYSFGFLEHLFGVGDVEFPLVENDIIDIYGKFGLLIFVIVFSLMLKYLCTAMKNFWSDRNLSTLCILLALTIYCVHGSLAGHALGSAQVNNLIMLVYFQLYLYECNLRFSKIKLTLENYYLK